MLNFSIAFLNVSFLLLTRFLFSFIVFHDIEIDNVATDITSEYRYHSPLTFHKRKKEEY